MAEDDSKPASSDPVPNREGEPNGRKIADDDRAAGERSSESSDRTSVDDLSGDSSGGTGRIGPSADGSGAGRSEREAKHSTPSLDTKLVRDQDDSQASFGLRSAPARGTYHLDVLIVAALDEEIRPAIEIFRASARNNADDPGPAYDATVRNGGNQYSVRLLCLQDMGGRAANLASVAVAQWQPRNVLLIGIAAMNPRTENLRLGDLLIATDIVDTSHLKYDGSGGDGEARRRYRSESLPCDRHLVRPLRDFALRDSSGYRATVGAIISSDRLVKDAATRDELLGEHHHAIGLEMEGHGLANAVAEVVVSRRPSFAMVKAAVDLADAAKSDDYHASGARAAAQFVYDFLRTVALPLAAGQIQPPRPVGERRRGARGGLRSTPLSDSEVHQRRRTLILPIETEEQVTGCTGKPLVAVVGRPGTGRDSIAIDLLAARRAGLHYLSDLTKPDQLLETELETDQGYILKLVDPVRLTSSFLRHLTSHLKTCDASLALVATGSLLSGDGLAELEVVRAIGVGNPYTALCGHLRFTAGSDEQVERALQLVHQQLDRVDLSTLNAQDLVNAAHIALDWAANTEGTDPPDVFGKPGRALWAKTDGKVDDRIVSLAHAAFNGMPVMIIERAAAKLQALLLPGERDQRTDPFGDPESVRNSRLGISRTSRSVGFYGAKVLEETAIIGTQRAADGLLEHVWSDYPQLQNNLAEWLIELAAHGPAAQRDRAASAVGLLASLAPTRFIDHPITTWANARHRRERRNAGFALAEMLRVGRAETAAGKLVADWSASDNERRRATACHAAMWAVLQGERVDPELIARAAELPNAETWINERSDGNRFAAIDELQYDLWLAMLVAEDYPANTAHLFDHLLSALETASRPQQRNLLVLIGRAMYESEGPLERDDDYGDLYLARTSSIDLTDATARLSLALLEPPVTSRWMGRIYQAWCWAAAEHPTHAEQARRLVEVVWDLAPERTRRRLAVEVRYVARRSKLPPEKILDRDLRSGEVA